MPAWSLPWIVAPTDLPAGTVLHLGTAHAPRDYVLAVDVAAGTLLACPAGDATLHPHHPEPVPRRRSTRA